MILVSNRITVNPDYAEAFEATFQNRAGRVENMEGFVRFQILRPTQEGQPYVVQTFWENAEAFENWKNSDAFKAQHGRSRTLPEEALLGRPQIEVHEITQVTQKANI